MSLNESAMQSHSLHPQDAVYGFGCSQQVFCRAKFAFAERSAVMKAPVGLLSNRTVCDSRWRGLAPTSSRFDVKFGCVADGCRLVKGCIRKWVHGFLNGQPELSTAKEATVKNMEVSL